MAVEKIKKVEPVKVKKKRGPKPKIDEYYVNPADFKQQIRDYYKSEVCIHELANSLKKIIFTNFFSFCRVR